MTTKHAEQLIQRFGRLVTYLGELSPDEPMVFHSEELLPADRKQIEEAATLCSVLATAEEGKETLNQVRRLLNIFIPHEDALIFAQSWNKIKPKFEGKDYDKNAEKVFTAIIGKYLPKMK
jgi:hypothetical protein